MKKMWTVLAALVAVGVMAGPAEAKASKSCIQALDAAEEIVSLNVEYVDATSALFGAMGKAPSSSLTVFMGALTKAVGTHADATGDLTPQMRVAVAEYNSASKKCRAGK